MRLTYVTSYDAMDVTSFSGVSHYLTRALIENGCEIDYIGNLVAPHSYFLKLKRRIYTRLGKKFEFDREPIILKNYAKQIEKKLKPNTNIIFSPGTLPVAFLKNRLPKVIYADATFAAMVNFYEEFSNLSKETIRHGNRVEKKSLENASLILYSSDWAAKSAIEDYQISPEKIRVVPFGANFDSKLTFKDV